MKNNERKAVERAIEPATRHIKAEYQTEVISPKMLQRIAQRAVIIAQLRAGRTYDTVTANEARAYAYRKVCELYVSTPHWKEAYNER